MSHTPKALILDFGGVLTTDLWASIRACARRERLPETALLDLMTTDPDIHPLFVGLERGDVGQLEFEARLAAAAGISPHGLLRRMCADLRPDHAMLAAVAELRASGVRIGVLSNSWGSGYFSPYDGYDLEDRADAVVFSDRVQLRKPEREIFELMLGLLGVEANDSVFIDDVSDHLRPAAAIGLQVIHHVDTGATLAELERRFGTALWPSAHLA